MFRVKNAHNFSGYRASDFSGRWYYGKSISHHLCGKNRIIYLSDWY
ncbi:hypothetical protein B4100_1756 [Heyndrickxia coagulans]|nr:hypothetical protein B4100_1756 [Heyndrickxia coagulans]